MSADTSSLAILYFQCFERTRYRQRKDMHRDATKGCPLPEKNEVACEIFFLLLKIKLRGYSVCLQTSANNRSPSYPKSFREGCKNKSQQLDLVCERNGRAALTYCPMTLFYRLRDECLVTPSAVILLPARLRSS